MGKKMDAGKEQKEQFVLIRDWMLDMDLDTAAELNIFARIYSFSQGDGGVCWEAASNIGRWGKTEQRHTYTILKRLEEKGYIEKVSQGAGKTCLYKSTYNPCTQFIGHHDLCTEFIGQSPNLCTEFIGTSAQSAYNNKEDNKDSSILNESISEMEDFNQASSLPIEPTGPVDLTNPASFLRSSSLANQAPSSSTYPAGLAPSSSTRSTDFAEPSNPNRLTRSEAIGKAKKIFKEAGLSTKYGMKTVDFMARVDELLEILNEQGCTYGEFEDVIRSFANDESFDGRNLANAFHPNCYNRHINRSKSKKVEDEGESIW